MKFIWEDNFQIGHHKCRLLDDECKELDSIWLRDYTNPWQVSDADKNQYDRPYAYEVGYCSGFSMHKGFDLRKDWNQLGGWRGTPEHTLEDVKRWCEEYIAGLYMDSYLRALTSLHQKKQLADWFAEQGYLLDKAEAIRAAEKKSKEKQE